MVEMAKLNFTDSMNRVYEDISAEEMRNFVFYKGDDFWAVGSGTASLDFLVNGIVKSYLSISASERDGFLIGCGTNPDDTQTLLDGSGAGGEIAEVFIAGEMVEIYKNAVVSKELAWRAIEYFMKTGERDPELEWGDAETPV